MNQVEPTSTPKVELIWLTPYAEDQIAYCARVSCPPDQRRKPAERLLRYCYDHKHWSVFEMANLCVEVSTTRDIARQILRHRSFSFQEFSQRYSVVPELLPTCARRQDTKNRQNSFNDLDPENLDWFARQQQVLHDNTLTLYSECLSRGIAKESCRFLLPGSAQTFLAVNGTIRSWIHYLLLRADPTSGTQLEHLELAQTIREKIVQTHLPITYKLLHPSCGVKS